LGERYNIGYIMLNVLGDQTIYWDGGELARIGANRKAGTGWGQMGTTPVMELVRANRRDRGALRSLCATEPMGRRVIPRR
jgi:hypothetical protein